jgi:hypothetical protein
MVLGVHALPVRSDVAAADTRRTLFFSLLIVLAASAIADWYHSSELTSSRRL